MTWLSATLATIGLVAAVLGVTVVIASGFTDTQATSGQLSAAASFVAAPTPTPGPPAVGGIVELRTDPDAQSDSPASDSWFPLPVSVAIGLLIMGAGGLYVVKMRRG